MLANVNWWVLLLAAIVNFALGSLWYSNFLFGKKWRSLMGFSEETMRAMSKSSMTKIVVINFVADLFTGLALWSIGAAVCTAWSCLNVFAFVAWLGFMLPILVGAVLWEGRSWHLFWINAGYRLLSLWIISAVIAQFVF